MKAKTRVKLSKTELREPLLPKKVFFTYLIAEIEINLHGSVINDNLIIVNSLKAF